MRFLSNEYPELLVHGVVKFREGVAEVTDSEHIDTLTKLERYGVVPAEPVAPPKPRGRPRKSATTSDES